MTVPLRVTVWNENIHERRLGSTAARLYPDGMHGAIAAGLRAELGDGVDVHLSTMEQPDHGLTADIIAVTVLGGMGIIVLHSGHYSKIFRKLMGTTCSLRWRNDGDREVVWTVDPTHPIAEGVPDPLVIEGQEMYGEFFDIPTPEELIFISSFSGGEVFRSGATWTRGHGRVFYFSPGDQEYPVYHHPSIHRVLANGVRWAASTRRGPAIDATFHARGWFDGGGSDV